MWSVFFVTFTVVIFPLSSVVCCPVRSILITFFSYSGILHNVIHDTPRLYVTCAEEELCGRDPSIVIGFVRKPVFRNALCGQSFDMFLARFNEAMNSLHQQIVKPRGMGEAVVSS